MTQFGAKLKTCRKSRGLTQKVTAQRIGVSHRAYQHYETGDRTPPLETLIKLAEIFDTTLDELSGRNCTPNRELA